MVRQSASARGQPEEAGPSGGQEVTESPAEDTLSGERLRKVSECIGAYHRNHSATRADPDYVEVRDRGFRENHSAHPVFCH